MGENISVMDSAGTTIDIRVSKLLDRIEELETALKSIAANTCCDRCQEAALVAQKALNPDNRLQE